MQSFNLIDLLETRHYVIAFIEGNGCLTTFLTLDQILQNTTEEYKYAIIERMDEIICLSVGDRLRMSFNRDNTKDSEGYIKRIEPSEK